MPSLTAVGEELRGLQQEQNYGSISKLTKISNVVTPIASGFPVQQGTQSFEANPVGMAAGGALTGLAVGDMFGKAGMGAAIGGGFGLLGGLL